MFRTVCQLGGGIGALTLLAILLVSPVMAAGPSYSLFGDATLVHPGNNSATAVQASQSTTPVTFGGVDFSVPSVTTLSTVNNLSTDLKNTMGGCGSGSPRFSVVTTSVVVYFSINTCPPGVWVNSGNLASPTSLVTTSADGSLQTYASVQATYGSSTVTDIVLVTDPSFVTPSTFQFDNSMVNEATFTYEPPVPTSADQCKHGGYQNFGTMFKNQGDCVSFVHNGK